MILFCKIGTDRQLKFGLLEAWARIALAHSGFARPPTLELRPGWELHPCITVLQTVALATWLPGHIGESGRADRCLSYLATTPKLIFLYYQFFPSLIKGCFCYFSYNFSYCSFRLKSGRKPMPSSSKNFGNFGNINILMRLRS